MIHFIFGLPGTGKTTEITNRIQADIREGKNVLLIVPEQQTVEAERTMLKLLPPSAQLSFEVVNFTRLANKLFRIFGGLSYHYITSGMKHLFMWQTLRELTGILREYRFRAENDIRLPAKMLTQINEFKAYNVSPVMMETAAKRLPEHDALRGKLEDLALIRAAYERSVDEAYDDNADDLGKLADLLEHNRCFDGYSIYIDSFSSFTAQEYRIIKRLFALADHVTVSLAIDSPFTEAMELTSIAATAKKLMAAAGDDAECITLDQFHRFSAPELIRIGQYLWRFDVTKDTLPPLPEEERGAVEMLQCNDPYEEAQAIANRILALLADGYRRREIAVIARDAEAYRGILDATLEKAGIPFFLSEKTDLPAKPLISMILSALAIKVRNWRTADVIAYLKSGIPPIDARDADIFESYVSRWSISGTRFLGDSWTMNPDGYNTTLTERGRRILATANEVRVKLTTPLITLFTRLDGAKNAGELCEALRLFLEDIGAGERMKQYALRARRGGDKKEAAECSATFRAVIDVLEHIAAALGDCEMNVEEFSSALRIVFSNTDIGTIPTAADEVIIGSASMLRTGGIRCAIVMGLCDGEFPARVADSGFLSDNDRRALEELGISLSGDSRDHAAEELLYCYRAMTLPSDKLILSYHTADTGNNSCAPSLALLRVGTILPHLTMHEYGREDADERLMSPALAFEQLPALRGSPYYAPVVSLLSEDPFYAALIERSHLPVGNEFCRVSPDTAESIFGKNPALTQSKLDKFVSCHLAYYARYVLGLDEDAKAGFRYSDSGSFIHRILEAFMRAVTDGDGFVRQVEFEDIRALVTRETERYLAELGPYQGKIVGKLAHLFKRLSRLAVTIAADLYEEFSDSDFTPRFFEARIGASGELGLPAPDIELTDGSHVNIYGVIDRIDVYRCEDRVYIKVVDYKTGSKSFSLEDIERGLNTQLLLYLFAVCRGDSPRFRSALGCGEQDTLIPAGALYMSTAIPATQLDRPVSEQEALRLAAGKISRSGIVLDDDNVIEAMSREGNSDRLAGIKTDKKTGQRKGDALIREEALTMLEEQLKDTIRDIALEMKSGNAAACGVNDPSSPCGFCKMKQLCRVNARTASNPDDGQE